MILLALYQLRLTHECADLTDDPGLCGAFCVWLTKASKEMFWLSGRFLNAKWDADELLAMKDAIVEKNLLKSGMVVT